MDIAVLEHLADRAIALYEEENRAGRIQTVFSPYRTFFDQNIEYRDGGDCSVGFHSQVIGKPSPHPGDIFKLANELLAVTPEAAAAKGFLSNELGTTEMDADTQIRRLCLELGRVASKPDAKDAMRAILTRFTAEAKGLPQELTVEVELEGLWLSSEIVRTSNFTLRRPTAADVSDDEDLGAVLRRPITATLPPAFMEISVEGRYPMDVQEKLHQVLNVLVLYQLGNVCQRAIKFKNCGFSFSGGVSWSNDVSPRKYRFKVDATDSAKIDAYFEKMMPLVDRVARPITLAATESTHALTVAFERYKEAVTANRPFEDEVTSAITCLEALFLSGENTELKYRLAMRVAGLLRCAGQSSLGVFEAISVAYKIRSTHVHGSLVKEKYRTAVPDLAKKIFEYGRLSLNIFIRLMDSHNKEKLIGMIDRSLLDDEAHRELAECINRQQLNG
jgi:hypothetical protein